MTFEQCCQPRGIERMYIAPGKPDQNAFIERCNRTYRNDGLDAYLFESIGQVQRLTNGWLTVYNNERPHESLGCVPPLMFMSRQTSGASSYPLST